MSDEQRPNECDSEFSASHPQAPGHEHGESGDAHDHGGDQGHSHGLGGGVTATGKHRKRLIIALVITLSVVVVQLIGAFISGSLSLLADSGHMLIDSTGLAIALIASMVAALPATSKRTFGYLRVEVLAALVNGIVLSVIAIVIFIEAIKRFGTEVEISSGPMIIAAVIGGLANLVSMLVLASGQKESLNVRGAYLEVLGDLLGSVAVIIAGVVILFTGWNWVDQVASILIAVIIVPRAYSLLREVVDVLLEASPRGLDLDQVREHMLTVPGVIEVHDVHAWTITSGVPAFSAHVTVTDSAWGEREYHAILDELKACLRQHFDADHTTLQIEPQGHSSPATHRHA